MAIVAASTVLGMVTIGSQQIYAPELVEVVPHSKKLTDEFEKNVICTASVNPPDPDRIKTLVGEYSDEVLKLFPSTSSSELNCPGT